MKIDKNLLNGSTTMLILKLLENKDMYGYEMIENLEKQSNNIFSLKAGTLYPILHTLEQKEYLISYEEFKGKRIRKYYSLKKKGKNFLKEKLNEWKMYENAINNVLEGGKFFEV